MEYSFLRKLRSITWDNWKIPNRQLPRGATLTERILSDTDWNARDPQKVKAMEHFATEMETRLV